MLADGEPRDHRAVGFAGFADVGDVAVTVLFELWVEGQAVDLRQALDGRSQVHGQIGGIRRRAGIEGEDLALELDDEQPAGARCVGQDDRVGESEFGKNRAGGERWRRIGGTGDL